MQKNNFKIALMSLMIVCGANAANAQMGQMPTPTQRADQMKEVVKLTDDQYKKIVTVYKEQDEQFKKLMSDGGQPSHEEFGKIFQEQDKKLKETLTDEQYKKWQEHMQSMFGGMGQ